MKVHDLEFEKALKIERESEGIPGSEPVSEPALNQIQGSVERRIKMRASNLIFIGIIVVLAGALAWVIFQPEVSLPWLKSEVLSPVSQKQEAKKSQYQAVFLTNGQVYFGQLSGFPGERPVLKDVYYLRAQSTLQPSEEGEVEVEKDEKKTKETATPTPIPPQVTLIKLGNELHGPMDEIQLNPEHILFVEDLKEGSRIVKAIEEFKTRQR